jgi:hypothetical protein
MGVHLQRRPVRRLVERSTPFESGESGPPSDLSLISSNNISTN